MAYANLIQPTSQQVVDVDALKHKIICEYTSLLSKVRKGYKPDYEFILEEISFVELNRDNDLVTSQYYLNNKWQMIQS